MKIGGRRQSRIGDLIREKIAELIIEGIKDPQVRGLITVTHVETTPDLKLAYVYVSVLSQGVQGAQGIERRKVLGGLKRATGFIKGCLGHDLGLRFTPDIEFKLDDSFEYQQRIDELLKEAKKK
jgi:ribosome-binding factor A